MPARNPSFGGEEKMKKKMGNPRPKASGRSAPLRLKRVWCVSHRDGWCAMKTQPVGQPQYRDHKPTLCGMVVTLPWGFSRMIPSCEECRTKLRGAKRPRAAARGSK